MKGYLDALEDALQGVHSSTRGRHLVLTFTGSRDWPVDLEHVVVHMFGLVHQHYARRVVLSHGGARGADMMAHRQAQRCNWPRPHVHRVTPAEWAAHGGWAGHQRNARMLEAERPDLVIALIWRQSRGATGCADNALARGIPVVRVDEELALLSRSRATL